MARSDISAIACALVVHAIVFLGASRFDPPRPDPARTYVAPFEEVSVELEVEVPPIEETVSGSIIPDARSSPAPREKRSGSLARRERSVNTPRAEAGADAAQAPGSDAPPAGEEDDDWSDPSAGPTAPAPGLSLVGRVASAGGFERPDAAPTRPPSRPKITGEQVSESIRSAVRHEDAKLGLGNPEQTIVGGAVQVAGRATGVPNRTRFRVEITVDKDGNLLSAAVTSASAGSEEVWNEFIASVRSALSKKPIALGPDAKARGAKIVVDAMLIHAFPSGTDKQVVMGECPKLAVVGGEDQKNFHNSIGGEMFGEPGRGLCPLPSGGPPKSKTIQVRTIVKTIVPGEIPPPVETFGKAKKRPPAINVLQLFIPSLGDD